MLPAIARAYRAEIEALCAALSIEQLVKPSAARIGNPASAGSDAWFLKAPSPAACRKDDLAARSGLQVSRNFETPKPRTLKGIDAV